MAVPVFLLNNRFQFQETWSLNCWEKSETQKNCSAVLRQFTTHWNHRSCSGV